MGFTEVISLDVGLVERRVVGVFWAVVFASYILLLYCIVIVFVFRFVCDVEFDMCVY